MRFFSDLKDKFVEKVVMPLVERFAREELGGYLKKGMGVSDFGSGEKGGDGFDAEQEAMLEELEKGIGGGYNFY
jgi:hypothetical protein